MNEQKILQQANELARSGKPGEAEALLAKAARNDPANEQLVMALVGFRAQTGNLPGAVETLQKAIDTRPQNLNFLTTMARLVIKTDPAAAERAVRAALGYRSNSPELICMLGDTLFAQRKTDDALAAYRTAVTASPQLIYPYVRLGEALRMLRRFDESVSVLESAGKVDPISPEVRHSLGLTFLEAGKTPEAEAAFRESFRLRPNYIPGYGSLGRLLQHSRRFGEAEEVLRKALEIQPNDPLVHLSLGHVYLDQSKKPEAEASYRSAIAADHRFIPALASLSTHLWLEGRLMESLAVANHAAQVAPNSPEALHALGTILGALGRSRDAAQAMLRSWQIGGRPDAGSNFLHMLNYVEDADPQEVFKAHKSWAQRHADPVPPQFKLQNSRDPDRRLKIGYVSPDFRAHAVSYFIEPILMSHDHTAFEVYCYASVPQEDEVTQRLKLQADVWRDISRMNDVQAAKQVNDDGIDILIDLSGHTNRNRLGIFTIRPAPVQVTYLGYPNTTGMAALDYRITDGLADPEGASEAFNSEKLLRLPQTAWCYRPLDEAPDVGELPAERDGYITFGSFNRLGKLSAKAMDIWCKAVNSVPNARFMFKTSGLGEQATEAAVRDAFKKQGIEGERLILVGFDPTTRDHLDRYNKIDIALDTYPYHGTTTTCEALWMGVPSIVLTGNTHASRVGASLLTNVGLSEFAANSPEQFVEKAKGAASDLGRLAEIRRGWRQKMRDSPLMDFGGFTRELESAYREVWRQWCASGAG